MSDLARISDQPSVRVNRLLPAQIDEVYAAWTDPAFMCRWFSPTGREEVEVDVRVGGSLRVVMLGDGMRIDHTGEYLVVEPPRRLITVSYGCSQAAESSFYIVRLAHPPEADGPTIEVAMMNTQSSKCRRVVECAAASHTHGMSCPRKIMWLGVDRPALLAAITKIELGNLESDYPHYTSE